ncbi:OLC1v1034347C1 [Oldenlandia corymbosa var. corymbosa]|uniref:OLC1v1034347C1 n=1 Tax=Oldenlandia corymbosa var. corymbosa TaxID=529605 RepID=A0AAV1CRQ1_OLDCO|nr:OLC1v1034347C1 [Oldenlandia corymbosa var. corymbosa]
MKPVVVHKDPEKKDRVEIRAECRAPDEKKHLERVQVKTHDVETIKHIEKKLIDKGIQRLDRQPADGLPLKHDPKKGHGGKYSWEGPDPEFLNELNPAPPAIDEKDPNYVDDDDDDRKRHDDDEDDVSKERVVGEIETPKVAEEGVVRIEVDPHLKAN